MNQTRHRSGKKIKEGGLSDTIGFRAPLETRQKLERLHKLFGYSCNLVAIEAVNSLHDQIYIGPTHTPQIVLRGRALKDVV